MAIPVPRVTIVNAGSGNNQHPVHRVSIDLDPASAEQNTNGYELRYFYEVYDSVTAYDAHYSNSRLYTQPIDMFLNSNCVVVVHAAYYVIGENTHGAFGVGQCVSTITGRSHTWHWYATPGDTGDGFHRWLTDGTNTVRPVEYPVYDTDLDALVLRRGSWVSYDLARTYAETNSKPELSQALSGGYTLRFRINTANAPADFGNVNDNSSFMFCFGEAKFEYGIPCLEISRDQVRLRVARPSINGYVITQSIDGLDTLGAFTTSDSTYLSTGTSKNIEVLVHVAVSTSTDPTQQNVVMGVEVSCPDVYDPYSGLTYTKSSITGIYTGARPDKFVIGCPADPTATNTQPAVEFITLSSVALYDHQNTMIVYQRMYNNEPISKPFSLDNCEDDLPAWWIGGDTDPVVPHRNGTLSWLAAGNKNTMFLFDRDNGMYTMPSDSPFTMALDFSQVTTGQVEIRFPYSTSGIPGGYDSYPSVVYDAASKTITLHTENRIGNSAAGDMGAWRGTKFHSTVLQIHAAPASTYGTNGYKRIIAMVGDCASGFANRADSGNAKLFAIGVTEQTAWNQFTQPFFISSYATPERAGFNICSRSATGQVLISQLSRSNFISSIDTEVNAGPIFDAKRCETPKFKLTNIEDNAVRLNAWCDITGVNGGNWQAKYGCRIRYTVDGTEPISSHTTLEMPTQGVVLSEASNIRILANEAAYNLLLHRSSTVVGTQVLDIVPDLVDPGKECYTNVPVTVAFSGSDAGSTLLVDSDAFDTVPETETDSSAYTSPVLVTRKENEKITTRRGFALGSNKHVYVWSDAGKWKRLTRTSIPDAVALAVSEFHEAYVVTSTGKLYRSMDLVNYREITGPAIGAYAGVACRGSIVCVLPAGTSTVFHVSFDSGATWETRDLPESGTYTVLEFADDLVFMGTANKLWKSVFSTASLSYTAVASPAGSLRGIACGFDANKVTNTGHRSTLVAVTSTGVYQSGDDATTWSVVDSAVGTSVVFTDAVSGSYVVGMDNALSRRYSNTGYTGTVKPSTGLLACTSAWLIQDHWFELSQYPFTGTTSFNGSALLYVPDNLVPDYVGGILVGIWNQGIYRAINNQDLFSVDPLTYNVVCEEPKKWQGLFLYNNTVHAIVNDSIGNGGGLYTVDPTTHASTLVLALDTPLFACLLGDKVYIGLGAGGIADVNLTAYTYTTFGTPNVYGSGAVNGTALVVSTAGVGVVHVFDTTNTATAPTTLSYNQRLRAGMIFYKDRYYFTCENSLWELVLVGAEWHEHLVSRALGSSVALTTCCIAPVVRDPTDTSNPGGTRIYATAFGGVVYNARMISAPLPYMNTNARFSTRAGVRRKRLLFGAYRSLLPVTASVFDCIRGSVTITNAYDTTDSSPRGTCSRMVITAPTGGVRLQRDRVSARMLIELKAFNHFRLKLLGSPFEIAWRNIEGVEQLGIFKGSTLVQSAGNPTLQDGVVFNVILSEYNQESRARLTVIYQSYASADDLTYPMKQVGLEFTTDGLEAPTQLGFILMRHIGFAPQSDTQLEASQHRVVVPGVGVFTQAPSNVIRVPKNTAVQVFPGRVNYAPVDFDFNVLDTEVFASTLPASNATPAITVYKPHALSTDVSTHSTVIEMPMSGYEWHDTSITIDDNCVLAYMPVGPTYGFGFPQELYVFVVDETAQAGPQLVTFARYAQTQHGASRTPHVGLYGSMYTTPVNKLVHAGKQNQEYSVDSNSVFDTPDSAGGSRGVTVFASSDYAQDSLIYSGSEFDNDNASVIEFAFEKPNNVGSFVLGCGFGSPDKEFLCLHMPRIYGRQPSTSEFAQAGVWNPETNSFAKNTTVVGMATPGNGLFPEARRVRIGRKIVGGVQYMRLVYLITSRYRQSVSNVPEMYVQYDSEWVALSAQTGRRPFITMLTKHSNQARCPAQVGFPVHYGWFNLNAASVENVLLYGMRVQPPVLSVTSDVDLSTVTLNQQVTLTVTPPEGMTGTYYAKVYLDGDDQIIPLQSTTDMSPSPPTNGNNRYYVGSLSESGSTITLTAPFRIAVCAVYDQQLLGGRATPSPVIVLEAKVNTSDVVSVVSTGAGEVTLQINLPEQDAGTLCFEFDDLKIEEFAYSSYIFYNKIKRKIAPGQHTVRLVRWGSSNPNYSNSWWKSAALEPMEFTVPDKLDANLTITPGTVAPAASVVFAAEVIGGTAPFTYLYRFGDGTESTQANPTHQYEAPGVYDVSLEIRDVNGDSKLIKRHGAVTVLQSPLTNDPLSLLKTTRIS